MIHSTAFISKFATLFFCIASLTTFNNAAALADDLIKDDFSSESYAPRNAARGDWKIEDGVASVKQNDEQYKKHKNHGPIVIYTVAHDDATAVMEFKPTGCKTVVFTMDAEEGGHAFRVKMRTASKKASKGKGKKGPKSTIVTYAAKVGDKKAEQIELSNEIPKLIDGQWNRLEVTVKGDKATVKLGDQTVHVQHARIDQKKKIAKLSFSFGGIAIRKFELSK